MDNKNLDRLPVIAAAAGSGTGAVIIFALMPILVGGMAERYALNDLQSGLVATQYFSTYALVALSSPLWVRIFNWRRFTLAGFILMVLGVSVALSADTYSTASWAIAAAGIGAGLLFPISLTLVSDMIHTERVYSIKLAVEQLVPAGLLLLLATGWLFGADIHGALSAILVTLVLCALASVGMPQRGNHRAEEVAGADGSIVPGILALTALAISFAGFAGLWVFLERIAVDNGFDAAFTNRWLAVGLITSGVGPLLAACLADRLGMVKPVLLSTVLALTSIAVMYAGVTMTVYALVLVVLPLAYYFALSYFFSIIAAADSNGKISGLMSFALAVGAAAGPALIGAVKSEGGPILAVVVACIVLGAALIMWVAGRLASIGVKHQEQE